MVSLLSILGKKNGFCSSAVLDSNFLLNYQSYRYNPLSFSLKFTLPSLIITTRTRIVDLTDVSLIHVLILHC